MGTYPGHGDNHGPSGSLAKVWLIPDDVARSNGGDRETGLPVWERPMSYQVVGRVTAYQAYDG